MGAQLARVMKNFNVESRAHRLIGRDKPLPAPMHPGSKEALAGLTAGRPEIQEKIYTKDSELVSRLKDVYVDSTDPLQEVNPEVPPLSTTEEFREPKQIMSNYFLNLEVESIPKGKISIIEALTILQKHKQSPKTWTAARVAEEYSLNSADTDALLKYFQPFNIKIIEKVKQITDE